MGLTIRSARPADASAIVAFTEDTWSDRDRGDYLPAVIDDWIEASGDRRQTFVADRDGEPVGILQAVRLTPDEAWLQGLRVAPSVRGHGIGTRLCRTGFDWARERGAVVARSMVFSWNAAGLGVARAAGFEPVAEFRWAHPEPDATGSMGGTVTTDPGAGWQYWVGSSTRDELRGLALDVDESWALSVLSRDDLVDAADRSGLVVTVDAGTTGLAVRTRTIDRDTDNGGLERWAEYGIAAWADGEAATLFEAIARDAAECGADRTRVLIPETAMTVSDAVSAGAAVSNEPDFVMGTDLTGAPR